jgi:hypothetical protein
VRKLIAGTFMGLMVLGVSVAPVLAAGPERLTFSGSDVDPDFCGTGQTVNLTQKGVLNSWDDKAFGHIQTTWTNPANGIAIYDSFSGGGWIEFIDDGDGAYTVALTRVGQPARLQYVGGPVIVHDAGLIEVHDHFDADDNYLGTDIVVVNGPHPGFDMDWCDLMIDALQL